VVTNTASISVGTAHPTVSPPCLSQHRKILRNRPRSDKYQQPLIIQKNNPVNPGNPVNPVPLGDEAGEESLLLSDETCGLAKGRLGQEDKR